MSKFCAFVVVVKCTPVLLTMQLLMGLFFLTSLWNCPLLELEIQSLADLGKSKFSILGFWVLFLLSVLLDFPFLLQIMKTNLLLPFQSKCL